MMSVLANVRYIKRDTLTIVIDLNISSVGENTKHFIYINHTSYVFEHIYRGENCCINKLKEMSLYNKITVVNKPFKCLIYKLVQPAFGCRWRDSNVTSHCT